MANQPNSNQFRDDGIIRLRQACPGGPVRLGQLVRAPVLCSDLLRRHGKAVKASAEFRSRYPVPLRGSEGSFIILEQLRDGKMVESIHPKIGGRLTLAHEENDQLF